MSDYPYLHAHLCGINRARVTGKNLLRKVVEMMLREVLLTYRETNMATVPLDSHN